MITRRYLEKKSTVLGLPMAQVGLLVLLMVTLIIVSTLSKLLFPHYRWFNHLTVLLVTGGYFGLRYASAKKHPSYLSSRLSYTLLQRRRYYEPPVNSRLEAKKPNNAVNL